MVQGPPSGSQVTFATQVPLWQVPEPAPPPLSQAVPVSGVVLPQPVAGSQAAAALHASPAAQVTGVCTHWPLAQASVVQALPSVQPWPQDPQLLASVVRSTQAPLQRVKPAKQVIWHWPPTQLGVAFAAAVQLLPQLPQLVRVSSGVQVPLQHPWPGPQFAAVWQLPAGGWVLWQRPPTH